MKLTLENIIINDHRIYDQECRYRGEILYEYIRGSQLYNTNLSGTDSEGNPLSDEDHGGIFIMPNDACLGLGLDYQNEIKDSSNDTCIWEIGRFLELTMSSNPTVLEALFVPDDKVIYEHPIIKELRSHRDEFISKKCFVPFGGYAISQIKKAQGQNKKIHWDVNKMVRKTPMDFCYTFHKQGSKSMEKWLEERGLNQRNCGLVNIPNMDNMYGVYYDFGQHIRLENITKEYFCGSENKDDKFLNFCFEYLGKECLKANVSYSSVMEEIWDKYSTPKGGFCGIISPDGDSNALRLSSVPDKNDKPLCFMSYNQNAYASHCREYREYEEWKRKRNKARYESNMEGEMSGDPEMQYDVKNMYHCFRNMAMAKEIAEGKGLLLDRTNIDRDFLLDVRKRKYKYSEINKMMLDLKEEMDKAIEKSTIKEDVDIKKINEYLLTVRKKFKD